MLTVRLAGEALPAAATLIVLVPLMPAEATAAVVASDWKLLVRVSGLSVDVPA